MGIAVPMVNWISGSFDMTSLGELGIRVGPISMKRQSFLGIGIPIIKIRYLDTILSL